MATVVLNVAVELSARYDERIIETSLLWTIDTKWDLAMKLARETNDSGGGFVDIISCPTNIVMSWSTVRTTGIATTLWFSGSVISCKWTSVHNGGDLELFFNASYDDFAFAEYNTYQVPINTWNLSDTFSDADSTFIDLWSAAYLSADGIDDNFDSDNYSLSSSWTTYYPDGYRDNDDLSKLLSYGYVIENSWLYNAFWSNTLMQNYIAWNTLNTNPYVTLLWDVSSGYLYFDINTSFRLILFELSRASYNTANELVVVNKYTGTGELADIWYLQTDMSLSSSTGSAFDFDFTANDYALFIENTSSGALLYRITGETSSGNDIYLNPLRDDDSSIFSYYWSHVLIDDQARLIWQQLEVFWLK